MANLLDQLQRDHVNLNRLLRLLEAEGERIRAGGDEDLALMADIIEYMESYPDVAHHPLEDALVEHYLAHHAPDAEVAARFRDTMAEHAALRAATHALRESIESLLNDVLMPREDLLRQLDDYIALQRRHLQREERELFPRLRAAFGEADWRAVAARHPARADPLFSERLDDQFRGLLERILASEGDAR